MTPPNVIFVPAPSASLGNLIVSNAPLNGSVGATEIAVELDGSSSVVNSWDFNRMFFRDAVKNGVWTDDGLGLLWDMKDATNYANWQGYIGTGPGTFSVYETGTSTLVFSLAWTGENQWSANVRRYGTSLVDFTGSVSTSPRVDVYHV